MNSVSIKKLSFSLAIALFSSCSSLEAAWSAPLDISQALVDSRFNQVVSADDTAVAMWLTFNSVDNSDVIFSSTRSSGGVWSVPVAISATTDKVIDPIMIVDSTNTTFIFWIARGAVNTRIMSAMLPYGGAWASPDTVYTSGAESVYFPSLKAAANSQGETILTWTVFDGTNFQVESATFTP